jgi:hypothetical protein
MKNKLYLLPLFLVGLFLMSFSYFQIGGAQIEFKKEVHDYGTIKYGGNGVCTFEFTNTGTAPLIITKATAPCNCTVPDYPKEPIPPGGKGVITVKYNTKIAGPITKSITILSNAVNDPSKIIRIKGNVNPAPDGDAPVNSGGPRN